MSKKKMQPKAAIYDRWLYTLGGGEQVAFAYAEVLRDLGYETHLLTHKEVDLNKAEQKMGVDLKDIHITYLPITPSIELSGESEKYDVFINTSYMDYFPNRSKRGILSVFFPAKIQLTLWDYLKIGLVLPSLKKFFIYPLQFSGFRYDEKKKGSILKWLGKSSEITFNEPISQLRLQFHFPDFTFSLADQLQFFVNDVPCEPHKKILKHSSNNLELFFAFESDRAMKFTIIATDEKPKIALLKLTVPGIRYEFYNAFKTLMPQWEMRLHGGPDFTKRSDLQSYDEIIAISAFVQHWIQQYWHLDSTILYPPVQVEKFHPAKKKKNWIIHIGRFFVTGHNKKQREMAQTFTELVDSGVKDWELHFIGSVHEGEKHEQYYQEVVSASEGYPIHFHNDISADELRDLLGQAKIYWHATGLDEDENQQPILLEHFGITTVEAMAAGCVPIVIAKGGQKEIVTEDSGFRWNSRDELKTYTLQVIKDQKLWKTLSEGAQRRSGFFARKEFVRQLKDIIEKT